MANASSKKFGAGQQDQGKGDGTGGMTPDKMDVLPKTEVLSNRDTSRHSDQRGLDSRHVQTQQLQDHVADHEPGEGAPRRDDREKLADERPSAGEGMPKGKDMAVAGPATGEDDAG